MTAVEDIEPYVLCPMQTANTFWAKPKSKVRLIRQIENPDNCIEKILPQLLFKDDSFTRCPVLKTGDNQYMPDNVKLTKNNF